VTDDDWTRRRKEASPQASLGAGEGREKRLREKKAFSSPHKTIVVGSVCVSARKRKEERERERERKRERERERGDKCIAFAKEAND
jgi:hypothetical protein